MNRPIIVGLICELLAALTVERVTAMSVGLAEAIHNDDPEIEDDWDLGPGLSIGALREAGDFWNDFGVVNHLVASLLESETQRIANPVLAAINATDDECELIIRATDDLQREVVPEVTRRCKEMWDVPAVLRAADGSNTGVWTFFADRY